MGVLTMMEASKRDSVFHRLNPLTKLIFMAFMVAAPIITINPFVSLVLLAIMWILAWPSNLKDIFYPTMAKLYPVMLIFLFVVWPFFYHHGTHVLIHFGVIDIRLEGIYFALAQALRIAVAITGCCYFVMVTEVIDVSSALGQGLQVFGVSYTAPFMVTTAFKFLPEFLSTYSTIAESFRARAFSSDKGNVLQRIKGFIPTFIPLLDTSLGKSQSIASAMLLRAYGSKKKRTFYTKYKFGIGDVLFLALSTAMLLFAIWGEHVHLGGFDLHL